MMHSEYDSASPLMEYTFTRDRAKHTWKVKSTVITMPIRDTSFLQSPADATLNWQYENAI